MKMITCEDCKKRYDFDKDDFCPKCGAFNQPVKTWGTDAQGNVIRVDGVNEASHEKSFVHSEVHREKRMRRVSGLDQAPARKPRPSAQAQRQPQEERQKAAQKQVAWLIILIVALVIIGNFFLPLLAYLFF